MILVWFWRVKGGFLLCSFAFQLPGASDFLLIRLTTGALQLREITGAISVGQQHPTKKVFAHMSDEAKEFEEKRFVVSTWGSMDAAAILLRIADACVFKVSCGYAGALRK